MATSRYGWRSFEPGLARRSRSHSPQTPGPRPGIPGTGRPRAEDWTTDGSGADRAAKRTPQLNRPPWKTESARSACGACDKRRPTGEITAVGATHQDILGSQVTGTSFARHATTRVPQLRGCLETRAGQKPQRVAQVPSPRQSPASAP